MMTIYITGTCHLTDSNFFQVPFEYNAEIKFLLTFISKFQ